MPPRLNCSSARSASRALRASVPSRTSTPGFLSATTQTASRSYAASASATAVPVGAFRLPDDYIPPTKPPTARRPEVRKAQLLRAYTSLLRSAPLMLFFQHNNLTAVEWAAVRRELRAALQNVEATPVSTETGLPIDVASSIEFQVLRTRIFDVAFKIVQHFDPESQEGKSNAYTHDLSKTAYEKIQNIDLNDESTAYGQLRPILSGPLAAVTFPVVSPAHLAAVLSVLAPSPPAFPMPTRKKSPGYYELTAQAGLQKLLLVGGRIEGKVFDQDGVKWVGGIQGGLDGMRAQLVHMLQTAGLGLTTALEGHSKGLWLALEGRKTQLEEAAAPEKTDESA